MPLGFSFRPKELKQASTLSRRILDCMQCGGIVKRASLKKAKLHRHPEKIDNRGYVGCRNRSLVGSPKVRSPSATVNDKVVYMASYYTRLAEHFNLAGDHIRKGPQHTKNQTERNDETTAQVLADRTERSGLKSLLYQSLCTSIEALLKISKTKLVAKFGQKPGGYPVPNDQRPPALQFHPGNQIALVTRSGKTVLKTFVPWACARNECICKEKATAKDERNNQPPNKVNQPSLKIPPSIEYRILKSIKEEGIKIRSFKTLEKYVPDVPLLQMLLQLQKEGKVKLDQEGRPRRPGSSLLNLGQRRLDFLKQRIKELEQQRKELKRRRKDLGMDKGDNDATLSSDL